MNQIQAQIEQLSDAVSSLTKQLDISNRRVVAMIAARDAEHRALIAKRAWCDSVGSKEEAIAVGDITEARAEIQLCEIELAQLQNEVTARNIELMQADLQKLRAMDSPIYQGVLTNPRPS